MAVEGTHADPTNDVVWQRAHRGRKLRSYAAHGRSAMTVIVHEQHVLPVPADPDSPPMRLVVARPGGAGPFPAVVVLHELFGVNPDIEAVLDRLAEHGHLAVAPELYHRVAPAGAWLARDDEGRRVGFEHLGSLTRSSVVGDVRAVLDHLAGRTDADGSPSLLGFSAGGHAAFVAATELPIARTAVIYGGWLTSTDIALSRPEPTIERAAGIAAHGGSVLFVVGERDALISANDVDAIDAGLRVADVPHEIVVIPGAEHAFFWPGTDAHDAPAVEQAWTAIDRFLAGP